MALLEWSDEFSVGIEIIDKQHMIIVRAINLLAMAVERNGSDELLSEIFRTLVDYTNSHFAFEEELFDLYGYPQSDAHKTEHKALLDEVLSFKTKWEAGETDLGPDLLKFLVDWLRHHILGSDKKYSGFLVEHMATQRA